MKTNDPLSDPVVGQTDFDVTIGECFVSDRKSSTRYSHQTQDTVRRPRSGELRTQKLKSHLMRTQSLEVFPLKPGVGQYIAMRATLTSRDFFLAYFYPSGPFAFIFRNLSRV